MHRQRQRHFIGENADLLAYLRIFYNPTTFFWTFEAKASPVSKVGFAFAP
ncbi:MAG TPA: hypothetical protein VM911_20150 [Pyrinomonadaceae bacterium]|jgi:hypothetical protein|nr:hypothetical protein [Pyrinomonadaceae bacterium]